MSISDETLEGFINNEKPRLMKILKALGIDLGGSCVVDVGAEVGLSAQMFKELGAQCVIGYDINETYCRNRLNVFDEYYCREMTIEEYLNYIDKGYFIKFDCEGCEEKYIKVKLPSRGLICLHDWVNGHNDLAYMLIDNDFIPVFHSYDWREICYLKAQAKRI